MKDLSIAIDSLRGVFTNIPGGSTGLYPYENLKDIREVVNWLGYRSPRTPQERGRACKCITNLWHEMHSEMLLEFDRNVPIKPVSKYLHSGISIADKLLDDTLTDEDLQSDRRASQVSRSQQI